MLRAIEVYDAFKCTAKGAGRCPILTPENQHLIRSNAHPDQVNGHGRTNHSCNRPGGKSLCNIHAMKHMNAMPQAV